MIGANIFLQRCEIAAVEQKKINLQWREIRRWVKTK
jgi:hypothetical protein